MMGVRFVGGARVCLMMGVRVVVDGGWGEVGCGSVWCGQWDGGGKDDGMGVLSAD